MSKNEVFSWFATNGHTSHAEGPPFPVPGLVGGGVPLSGARSGGGGGFPRSVPSSMVCPLLTDNLKTLPSLTLRVAAVIIVSFLTLFGCRIENFRRNSFQWRLGLRICDHNVHIQSFPSHSTESVYYVQRNGSN